jgi:hypothetical protein
MPFAESTYAKWETAQDQPQFQARLRGLMEIRRMARVGGRTPLLVAWFTETAATRMGSADHSHQIVEQDGEFRASFPTSYPIHLVITIMGRDFDLLYSQPQWGNCSSSITSLSSSTSSPTTKSSSSVITTSGSKSSTSTTTMSRPTSTTSSSSITTNTAIPRESALPSCGQLCFNNMLAQYSTLGCAPFDSYCLCSNPDFSFGLHDCSNGACGAVVASTVIAFGSAYCSSATATHTIQSTSTASATVTGVAALPSCGKLCFNNMLAQYSALGCASPDSYCLCSNVNFSNGLRDCSNGDCGAAVASTVIAFGSAYCSSASATHTRMATVTGVAALPSCGQLCFNNMLAQYSALGCATPAPACLCSNVNFGYGLRDCSNGACGTAVASTVIAFGSSYCASATAAP